jgi:hypothetical protein
LPFRARFFRLAIARRPYLLLAASQRSASGCDSGVPGIRSSAVYASAPVFRSIAGGNAKFSRAPAIRMNSRKSHELRSIVGDDRFGTLTACRKAEEPRPKVKRPGAMIRATAWTKAADGSLQLETECWLRKLPPQPAVVSASLRCPPGSLLSVLGEAETTMENRNFLRCLFQELAILR